MFKNIGFIGLLIIIVFFTGCAKRIAVNYNALEQNSLTAIKTANGASYDGIVKVKKPSFIVLNTERNSKAYKKIEKSDIQKIKIVPPVYDYKKNVISEWEIDNNKGTKNTWLYTVGGAGLSFGASFFVGSLAHRQLSDSESKDEVLWGITGTGTVIGTAFFINTGRKKDRQEAVERIREKRYKLAKQEIESQKSKRNKLNEELDKEKKARQKQEQEMKRLMERLKDRENDK